MALLDDVLAKLDFSAIALQFGNVQRALDAIEQNTVKLVANSNVQIAKLEIIAKQRQAKSNSSQPFPQPPQPDDEADNEQGSKLGGLLASFSKIGLAIFGVQQAYSVLRSTAEPIYAFLIGQNQELEKSALRASAVLVSNTSIKDGLGQQIEGVQAILAIKGKLKAELAKLEIDTQDIPDVSSFDVSQNFSTVLQSSGQIVGQSKKFDTLTASRLLAGSLTAAIGASGLPSGQINQETRALLAGDVNNPDATLPRQFGINKEELDKATARGEKVDFILEKLKPAKDAAALQSNTISALSTNISDEVQKIGRTGGQAFDGAIEQVLKPIFDYLKANGAKIGEEFKQTLLGFREQIATLLKVLEPLGNTFAAGFKIAFPIVLNGIKLLIDGFLQLSIAFAKGFSTGPIAAFANFIASNPVLAKLLLVGAGGLAGGAIAGPIGAIAGAGLAGAAALQSSGETAEFKTKAKADAQGNVIEQGKTEQISRSSFFAIEDIIGPKSAERIKQTDELASSAIKAAKNTADRYEALLSQTKGGEFSSAQKRQARGLTDEAQGSRERLDSAIDFAKSRKTTSKEEALASRETIAKLEEAKAQLEAGAGSITTDTINLTKYGKLALALKTELDIAIAGFSRPAANVIQLKTNAEQLLKATANAQAFGQASFTEVLAAYNSIAQKQELGTETRFKAYQELAKAAKEELSTAKELAEQRKQINQALVEQGGLSKFDASRSNVQSEGRLVSVELEGQQAILLAAQSNGNDKAAKLAQANIERLQVSIGSVNTRLKQISFEEFADKAALAFDLAKTEADKIATALDFKVRFSQSNVSLAELEQSQADLQAKAQALQLENANVANKEKLAKLAITIEAKAQAELTLAQARNGQSKAELALQEAISAQALVRVSTVEKLLSVQDKANKLESTQLEATASANAAASGATQGPAIGQSFLSNIKQANLEASAIQQELVNAGTLAIKDRQALEDKLAQALQKQGDAQLGYAQQLLSFNKAIQDISREVANAGIANQQLALNRAQELQSLISSTEQIIAGISKAKTELRSNQLDEGAGLAEKAINGNDNEKAIAQARLKQLGLEGATLGEIADKRIKAFRELAQEEIKQFELRRRAELESLAIQIKLKELAGQQAELEAGTKVLDAQSRAQTLAGSAELEASKGNDKAAAALLKQAQLAEKLVAGYQANLSGLQSFNNVQAKALEANYAAKVASFEQEGKALINGLNAKQTTLLLDIAATKQPQAKLSLADELDIKAGKEIKPKAPTLFDRQSADLFFAKLPQLSPIVRSGSNAVLDGLKGDIKEAEAKIKAAKESGLNKEDLDAFSKKATQSLTSKNELLKLDAGIAKDIALALDTGKLISASPIDIKDMASYLKAISELSNSSDSKLSSIADGLEAFLKKADAKPAQTINNKYEVTGNARGLANLLGK